MAGLRAKRGGEPSPPSTAIRWCAWMVANDAAGEGVNLQRGAHLMVNYDLPWKPNRLEQRFGRIHRIGQTEVCHLWNLCAGNTREGEVYRQWARTAIALYRQHKADRIVAEVNNGGDMVEATIRMV